MKDRVKKILEEINSDINENINLVEEGILDSFDIINIISTLEDEFNISVDAEDIVKENFESVEDIVNLVERLNIK
ncbi:acyl carrier protein [[Clostridium] colinum]|uniref:acyl carrier protein n=1 Tax=[Clostridium] colinum TaxID=36835 RepID=UPI002024C1CE|nr:acyl carrier protein [[Clostridium] colinum]